MTLQEAIEARHSVRRYQDRPIEDDKIDVILSHIEQYNKESGLHIQFVRNEPKAFSTGIFKYGQFEGVNNYLVLVAPRGQQYDIPVGYYGQRLVLLMQTLGLNTCWVALTFKNIKDAYELRQGEQLRLVIACGYGQNQGTPHPQKKPLEDFFTDKRQRDATLPVPDWFMRGMRAALLAPTAVNQQKFMFHLMDDNQVWVRSRFTPFGNALYDLGIVRCNFETAAGADLFTWYNG
ncbi:MAG: nitroreductase [Paludibacteraceae bacterium]|nr:nitroreductase [Paludibacteraceae bacterium]